MSAPQVISSLTIYLKPKRAAQCRAVSPRLSPMVGLAPASNKRFVISKLFFSTLQCSGVFSPTSLYSFIKDFGYFGIGVAPVLQHDLNYIEVFGLDCEMEWGAPIYVPGINVGLFVYITQGVTFEEVDAVYGVAVVDCVEEQIVALELGQLNFIHKDYNSKLTSRESMESPPILQTIFYLDELFTQEVTLRYFEDHIQRVEEQQKHASLEFRDGLNYTLLRGMEKKSETEKYAKANGEIYGVKFTESLGYPPADSFYLNIEDQLLKWHHRLRTKLYQRGFHELYKAEKRLGKGYSAIVYEGTNRVNGQRYAVKAFSKNQLTSELSKYLCLKNEIKYLRMLSHHNIITLHEVFQTDSTIYLVLELLHGGTIHDYLLTGTFTPAEIQIVLKSLLSGVQYLHEKGIIHRDLKPANLMLRENKEVVIVDFGLATTVDEELHAFYRCGTPGYASPEIINSKAGEKQSTISDIFSVGSVAYSMTFRKSAFKGTTPKQIINANRKGQIDFNPYFCSRINPLLLDLIKRMMDTNPSTRITAKQALEHPFLSCKDPDATPVATPMFGASVSPHFTFSFDEVKVDTPISNGVPNFRHMKSIITAKNQPKTPITPNSPTTPISLEDIGAVNSPKPPKSSKRHYKFSLQSNKLNDKFLG